MFNKLNIPSRSVGETEAVERKRKKGERESEGYKEREKKCRGSCLGLRLPSCEAHLCALYGAMFRRSCLSYETLAACLLFQPCLSDVDTQSPRAECAQLLRPKFNSPHLNVCVNKYGKSICLSLFSLRHSFIKSFVSVPPSVCIVSRSPAKWLSEPRKSPANTLGCVSKVQTHCGLPVPLFLFRDASPQHKTCKEKQPPPTTVRWRSLLTPR